MSTTTLTKSARVLVARGTPCAAGATVSGVADLRAAQGAVLTARLTNGGTAPSAQCECAVQIAHADAPAAADWRTIHRFGGGVAAGSETDSGAVAIDPAVMHVRVVFNGNAGAAVTVEALLSAIDSAQTV